MRLQSEIEQRLRQLARDNRRQTWLKFRDEEYTWDDAISFAQRAANGLLRLGAQPGDPISIMAANRPEFIWTYLGILFMGGLFVPLNRWQRGPALEHMIKDAGVRTVIYDRASSEFINPLRETCPTLTTGVILDGPADDGANADYATLISAPDQEPQVAVTEPSNAVGIIYTSGTTGVPKGVFAGRFETFLGPMRDSMGVRPGETLYSCMPLFHGSGLYVATCGSIRLGASYAMGESFSASGFWNETRRYDAVATHIFSSMFPILLKQPPSPKDADNPIRRVLSVGCPVGVWREFEERFGLQIVESYSMSDTVGMSLNLDRTLGSAGLPGPGTEFRIMDGDTVLEPDKLGEITMRHAAGRVTHYHNLPELTEEANRGGWFHTGDLGKVSADGQLYFCGRIKEAIRRRGENISAWEVATIIDAHPKVQESAVFAVASEIGEDEVMAVIVPLEGAEIRPEEILDFCQGRIAYYAMPRFIDIVSEIPKTGTQKVQHLALKERGVTPTAWDREKAGYSVRR